MGERNHIDNPRLSEKKRFQIAARHKGATIGGGGTFKVTQRTERGMGGRNSKKRKNGEERSGAKTAKVGDKNIRGLVLRKRGEKGLQKDAPDASN